MALQTAFQITQKASSLLAKRSRLAGLMLLWLSRQNDSAGNLAAEIPPACSMTLAFMHTRSPTAVPSACCGAVATPRPGWQEWREAHGCHPWCSTQFWTLLPKGCLAPVPSKRGAASPLHQIAFLSPQQ